MSTFAIPTMPDLDCPAWCDRDHDADWQQHVAIGLDCTPIPAVGGGFLPDDNRMPLAQWLGEAFEPLHLRNLSRIDLDKSEYAALDLQRGWEDRTGLYIAAEGVITSAQARAFAADLLAAADQLDTVTGR